MKRFNNQSATLNGKPYGQCFIDHKDLAKGGVLSLKMGSRPNKNWGIDNN